MSIFGFYFVSSMLNAAGWPRKKGWLGGAVYDCTIMDATINQMVNWGATIGAGRPRLALQMIAHMFKGRSWDGPDAPNVGMLVDASREAWDAFPADTEPTLIIEPVSLSAAFGASMKAKDFQDPRLRTNLEQILLEALIWGLANPRRVTSWYVSQAANHQASLNTMRAAGLNIDAPLPLDEFIKASETIVRDYEIEAGALPQIPAKLLSDARSLGFL